MSTLTHHYACMLGSHPDLSYAEVAAVCAGLPGVTTTYAHSCALVETPKPLDAGALMQRLGGTIKIVEVIGAFDEDRISDWLIEQVDEGSKFHFGFSVYALEKNIPVKADWQTLHNLGLGIKRALKNAGISARFVESREIVLSSVIVHKERLLKNGVEIVVFKGRNGMRFGRTLAVQPFQDFAHRDFGRPERDTKSGMLPPKVARMLVNIARPRRESVILDPFCGSGTVLQEALLMGFTHVRGSDHSAKAIADTRRNLEWMKLPAVPLAVERVEDIGTNGSLAPRSVDRIVFEGYLGTPSPRPQMLAAMQQELMQLYTAAFESFRVLLADDGVIVAALPFWVFGGAEKHLDIVRVLGRNLSIVDGPFMYKRPQSTVGREIIVVERRRL